MSATRTSLGAALLALALPLAGLMLWALHADSWSLGGRSPVLNYDSAQYALAARELAEHGRFATTFALPVELARGGQPPWPLAVVQPGLVVAEAALLRLVPAQLDLGRLALVQLRRPDQREWLALVVPFLSYLFIGLGLAILVSRLLRTHAPWVPEGRRLTAALTLGLAFYLDPEAQHFAVGGFTELPFTLGLLLAFGGLASGAAPRRPLLFGLVLGLTGTFRANMLWLAPVLALAATALAPRGRRAAVLALVLLGYAIPLAPWWLYKWRAFGSPAWDLTRYVVWDGVEGRTWFSLFHLPETPSLPGGMQAAALLAGKVGRNLPALLLAVFTGPRALWLGALVIWPLARISGRPALAEPERPLVVAIVALVLAFALGVLTAAASIPWLRFVFPARVLLEAGGVMALWGLVARWPGARQNSPAQRALFIAVGLLALGWGASETAAGNREARATSFERGTPSVLSMMQVTVLLSRDMVRHEPVMSNLGPTLAWTSNRPVIHLALAPEDLEACRRRLEFHDVMLVFRDADHAWPAWREIVAHPELAPRHPEWNVTRARLWRTADGFDVIWLELGPPRVRLGMAPAPGGSARPS